MGNNFTKTFEKWGLSPHKFTTKSKKKKDAPVRPPSQSAEAHMYDTVAEMPMYSKVNKKGRPQQELHYAEVQVLQPHTAFSRGSHRPAPASSSTEYATIDFLSKAAAPFHSGSSRSATSSAPADIIIPPGALQRPVPQPQPRKNSSKKTVVV
ncbi:uncharacterized protein zgc:193711 [Megalops cyprinoides]|uniref:uncharacterized protein zgc:193711 n=1 Tax=Megalops cyprinoides TaxID=118141 RepID=UPI001864BE21|nr:uncharacterized protein zgc:193711 [Megalops cyprinoides]